MPLPRRLREREARAVLAEEIARVGGAYRADLTRTDGPRKEANRLEWWYEGNVEDEGSITDRTLAFIRAYRRIAGETELYAQGLLLDKGRVHMDKYVIRRLHADGYLDFWDGSYAYFRLTPAGEELVETGRR